MHAYPNDDQGYDFESRGMTAYLRLTDHGWRLTVYRARGYDDAPVLCEHRTFRNRTQALRWFFAWNERGEIH